MHRCFIVNERWAITPLIPSAEEAHHILHVLRARDGERIRIFNGEGREADAILHCTADGALPALEIENMRSAPQRVFEIILLQAILKGNRMELLIEKATELGVGRIVPVTTSRVIPRFDAAQGRQKRERWERIAVSAAKQCGTPWLPVIEPPVSLQDAMRKTAGPLLLASLADNTSPLAAVIDELRTDTPSAVTVIIGPEGDLTADETQGLIAAGARPVSLGKLTLRAETAAIYAVSALACMLRTDTTP
jgi:16S rRNA (uracil1498-N3)-methyltransferase